MSAETITCPHCDEKVEVGYDSASCANCAKPFPWSIQVEKLQEQIKERETNRLRATVTLIQEAFEAAKGGKPVSVAAIKGFVASWLFPRTVVILGSLLGGVVLVAQTYILWNQTRLLELQTKAAQLEQIVKIRDRLAAIAGYSTSLARLKVAFGRELVLPPCQGDPCSSNSVRKTLRGLRADNLRLPEPEAKMMWFSLNNQLAEMSRETDRIVHQPRISIHEGELPKNLAVVTELLRPATTYCLLDGMQSAALIEEANAFTLLAASAHWILSPLNKPDEYINSYMKFPQVKDNTQMGLFLYEGAIERAITVIGKPSKGVGERRDSIDDTYSLADYVEDVKALHRALLSSLDALNRACRSLSEQDKAALSAINIATRQ